MNAPLASITCLKRTWGTWHSAVSLKGLGCTFIEEERTKRKKGREEERKIGRESEDVRERRKAKRRARKKKERGRGSEVERGEKRG